MLLLNTNQPSGAISCGFFEVSGRSAQLGESVQINAGW